MTDKKDWVPLSEAYAEVEHAYSERLRDPVRAETEAFDAIRRRLVHGSLMARAEGFSYFHVALRGEAETIEALSEEGLIPHSFWHDFNLASARNQDLIAGDLSFELVFDSGQTIGAASGISVNRDGLPVVGSCPPANTEPSPGATGDAPAEEIKLARGARVKYDPEEALVYLAAYAHLSNDGLSRRGEEHPSINSIADILVNAWAGQSPSQGTRERLARKVLLEIQRQKMAENRGGQ